MPEARNSYLNHSVASLYFRTLPLTRILHSIFRSYSFPTARKPECITSQLIWQHGSYNLHSNGTLQLYPIAREGAQLLTSSCPGGSPPEEMYDVSEEYTLVDTWIDLHHGVSSAALRLTDAWGNRSPSLWKIYDPPMMLPTENLYLEYIGIP